jgi:thiamine-monophosphate kinase
MGEFDLIRRLQEDICLRDTDGGAFECVVGIGDDGAVLEVPAGRQLVVCTDSLVQGVHFPEDTPAAAIGHKSLAVNLSDLAAMGARPAWFFMALTLPQEDRAWLDSFAQGMAALAADTGAMLAGGDITSGPLSVTVTALGLVRKGTALTRAGAREGDLVVVSGRPGAAASALAELEAGRAPDASDLAALNYPEPRLELGRALVGLASACIDLSDGLLADLGHILEQSGCGAELQLDRLPSPRSLSGRDPEDRWPIPLGGGDDYELCFTVPADSADRLPDLSRSCGLELTAIGRIVDRPGLRLRTANGGFYEAARAGYEHFGA